MTYSWMKFLTTPGAEDAPRRLSGDAGQPLGAVGRESSSPLATVAIGTKDGKGYRLVRLPERGRSMAWKLEGTYFENCSCEVACPCTAADFAVPADYDRCQFLMAFHVDRGDIDGLAVSDRSVAVVGDTPGRMLDG